MKKSPAQVLFDRTIRTWILPEAQTRAAKLNHSIVLRLALIIWEKPIAPRVLLNDEVAGKGVKLSVTPARPIKPGQPVSSSDVKGIRNVTLPHKHHKCPYILVIQGKDELFYLASKKMSSIVENREFELLAKPLQTEGVKLSSEEFKVNLDIDLTRNLYEGLPPHLKRRETLQQAKLEVQGVKREATGRVQRYWRLPAFIAHQEDEFMPLLRETRRTYVEGHFFSCIASAVTTADRICNRLMHRYQLPAPDQNKILSMTFGQKLQPLRAKGVIDRSLEDAFRKMNRIRTRHLHPKKRVSQLTVKRDARAAVLLLHEVLEETFSVYRDYEIGNGKLMPKPLV